MLCVIVFLGGGCDLRPADTSAITIVSYNVRGTFGDEAQQRMKAEQIAISLQEQGLDGSDIILFQEIDNRRIIEDLVSEHLILHPFRYAATAPLRGSVITQAVISRHPIVVARTHTIANDGIRPTRAFLEVVVRIGDTELVLYNLHLKSKRGGAEETEPQRAAVMRAVRRQIETRLHAQPAAEIIIAGDMNSEVGGGSALVRYGTDAAMDYGISVAQISDLPLSAGAEDALVFVSPWQDADWDGSYFYRQRWEQIDHFFLSQSLFDGQSLEYSDFHVAVGETQGTGGGRAGSSGAGSDHLPIVLTVVLR